MNNRNFLINAHAPVIAVHDPRSLPVRTLQFYRESVEDLAQVRVTQQLFDAAGRPVASRDPRLFELAGSDDGVPANLLAQFSLSAALLFSDSVDAGWRLLLHGEAGQVLERWDGRGTHAVTAYDEVLRPSAIAEQAHVVERFIYANADSQAAACNQCGKLLRHDHPAGSQWFEQYSIGGALLQDTRRFLRATDPPDWPLSETARDELLETLPGAVTRYACNPWAEAIGQTDAQGNVQRLDMTCAGALRSSSLQLAGQAEQLLVGDIRYNAFGQVEAETAGNGVQTRNDYDPASGRLQRLTARKADGTVLQDLSYDYDLLGNVLRIEDAAQATRYFRNQAVAAVSTYRYDTLYQLIEATGREALDTVSGPQLPSFQSPADPNQLTNYSQRYSYDAGGNLQSLSHVGGQQYTRQMTTARLSNRSLPVLDNHVPTEGELAAAFDGNGNLLELQRGQVLGWDLRNQLQRVTPVQREEAADDFECYLYDGNGQRVRKVRVTQAANITHRAEVRYLPGLEIRTDSATGETLQVIIAPAGRSGVRVLHWVEGRPAGIGNDQVRYSLSDHLGSSTLELDDAANMISQESYYPFGGTAWWAGRSAMEAKYKTIRYSGKERDASGLYYYGFRYYAFWLFRWLNPDPQGARDGLNVYAFCGSNPISRIDYNGSVWELPEDLLEAYFDDEADLITEFGLLPVTPGLPVQGDNSDRVSDQDSPSGSPGSASSQAHDFDSPGSPSTPVFPEAEQSSALDVLNRASPEPAYSLNSRGLLLRNSFGGYVYRADRRKSDEVLQQGFRASDEFTAITKMISGPALIVAETLEGALFYAAQSGHTYHFYKIDARDVRGVSLLENLVMNKQKMVAHIGTYPEDSPANQTGGADSMHEAHLSHGDLAHPPGRIIPLGTLNEELARIRARTRH